MSGAAEPGSPLPTVSVVIPAYQATAHLDQAIDSVEAQDYPPELVQIVVVDDGSRDATAELAECRAKANPRLQVLRQANAGPAAARNRGIQASDGELIAFLDSDDRWYPDKLRRQVELLQANPALGLVHGGCRFVDAAGQPQAKWSRKLRPIAGDALLDFFCDFCVLTSAMVVPRRCLDHVGHFDPALRVGEDNELILRLLAAFPAGCVDAPLLDRTIRADSLSREDFDLDARNDLATLDRFRQSHPEFAARHRHRIAERYARFLYDYGYDLMRHGHRRRAVVVLLRSWTWSPSLASARALVRSLLPRSAWRTASAA